MPRDLNTTSFALLALLAIRPWTTYELATQMDRSLRWFWPRAASVLYTEPKKLVRLGLATATREFTGRRPRTVYAITDTGRQALGRWLDQPGGGPILEFEALTQIAFADLGTRDQLLRTIGTVRADAVTRHDEALARIREYAETGGPFPERLPVIALVARLLLEYTELLARWRRGRTRRWRAGPAPPPPTGHASQTQCSSPAAGQLVGRRRRVAPVGVGAVLEPADCRPHRRYNARCS
jgi:PadR family transcriptional regulator, regulatory protein AphA